MSNEKERRFSEQRKKRNPKSREERMEKYISAKDKNLLPAKRKSNNKFRKFSKRIDLILTAIGTMIGTIFGATIYSTLLEKESYKKADELQDSIKEKINNMEDNEFYDFAKGIVAYHYNLENPETPILIDQVKIGITDGSNPHNPFKLELKERPDGTKYYEQIDLTKKEEDENSNQKEQTETGNGKVVTVTIKDPENIQIIKKYKAARGGVFRNGDPIEVYEEGEDTSKKSFLTENEYVYDILAEAITVYDHNNNIPAIMYRRDLIKQLPSYYLNILTDQIKNESKQVRSERIEGITVDTGIITGIEEKYNVKFEIDKSEEEEDIDRY